MRLTALIFFLLFLISCTKDCPTCEKEDCPTCEKEDCPTDLKKGLLAHYTFTGDFNDESGNNNHGVAINGAFLSTGFRGRPNTAAGFDGLDDYIMVQDNGKLTSDSVSISLWVMANNINRAQAIITRVNFENTAGLSWGVGQSLDQINKWEFGVARSSDACSKLHIYDPSIYSTSSQAITPRQWYHVVSSFVNGEQKLYIDGVLKASMKRDFKTLKKCDLAQLIIGGWWKGGILSLDGKIDEVRIYNRGLSDCEIEELSQIFE
jgi:hypothetical protein